MKWSRRQKLSLSMQVLGELGRFPIAMLPLGVAHGVFVHINQQQIFHLVASFVIKSNGNCPNRHLSAKILSSTIELISLYQLVERQLLKSTPCPKFFIKQNSGVRSQNSELNSVRLVDE
ncbi:MAG: hypothetical protein RMY16_01730 [Nostoc sp. DedQUE12b]|uniref:hypothetical protein n=1 Tax=Nostoc sp. DedQUE12b TaxID=3075398 RepID=UPI002AD4357C|nr:hypothetical protein [Nostoc sp. DedQUE12b]MDZ8084305.1 hypothetical protein [Nostoc sp. DedQUE12b]